MDIIPPNVIHSLDLEDRRKIMAKDVPLLRVDDKWSIQYDPENNDKPEFWYRHGQVHSPFEGNNAVTAMFYALLAYEQHHLEGG